MSDILANVWTKDISQTGFPITWSDSIALSKVKSLAIYFARHILESQRPAFTWNKHYDGRKCGIKPTTILSLCLTEFVLKYLNELRKKKFSLFCEALGKKKVTCVTLPPSSGYKYLKTTFILIWILTSEPQSLMPDVGTCKRPARAQGRTESSSQPSPGAKQHANCASKSLGFVTHFLENIT